MLMRLLPQLRAPLMPLAKPAPVMRVAAMRFATATPVQLPAKGATKSAPRTKKGTKTGAKSDESKGKVAGTRKTGKKEKKEKPKPWEKTDPATGKPVPLPLERKPTRRTSFIIYFSERVKALKGKPEFRKTSATTGKSVVDVTAITTAAGAEWKKLSPEEKHVYEKMAEEAKVQYDKDVAKWQESLTPDEIRRQNRYLQARRKSGKSAPSNLRDPSAPKRPVGAFFLYVQHLRDMGTVPGPSRNISRVAGERWKQLSAAEKEPFEKRAQAEYQDYSKRLEAYRKATAAS